jgi:hypothetical protein
MEENIEQRKYPVGKFIRPETFDVEKLDVWIAELEALPGWLDALIENLDSHQLETPYRPGGWTIQQVVHHLADSHVNAYVRLKLALTETEPHIKPYKEALWAELNDSKIVPINVSITLLHALHRRWTALLNTMKLEDWQRTYFHPDQKRLVPLWEMTAMYAWHCRHHSEHIRQLRIRNNW